MQNIDLQGLRTLIRLDLNVPIDDGVITSEARIHAAIPTIEMALSKGAKVALLSHLGRPDPAALDGSYSLEPVAIKLQELINRPVRFLTDWVDGIDHSDDEIILCENTRYHIGETTNDEALSQQLASLCDVFVMDAFGASHRQHASTYGAVQFASQACIGPLMSQEIESLNQGLSDPEKPLVAIIGGAKVSSKLGVIEALAKICDHIIVGGGIANTFLLAQGLQTGNSLIEPDMIDAAKRILNMDQVNVPMPTDVRVGKEFSNETDAIIKTIEAIEPDDVILDIGPATAKLYAEVIKTANTIIWNGPVGVFEFAQFSHGTRALANAVKDNAGHTIVGGGDTVAVIEQYNMVDSISYISTGGGAFLEFIKSGTLPILDLLKQ
ncbi:MAG TPA: phosphoglycerate kinase [Gammaproteobacteria bacterium]|nr:phosphoglycerate kinase [Gammaproteobacteria bacterium]HIK76984.1 phosphoglycerate kinase [Gammaproteobacteria bacterium]